MIQRIELSENMKAIWVTMLKSTESSAPSDSAWSGLVRVNKLTSDYVKEMYGPAAIEFSGRYYSPDCLVVQIELETALQKRERIRSSRT